MRKTQVALAAMALMASTAVLADGVKVSGAMDIGYQSGTGSASLNSNGDKRALVDSLAGPTFLNFSGSEDIGNGMKATFDIWTTPTPTTIAGGLVFLQQNVGLSGDFGGVKMGQMVDSFWGSGMANFDVTGGSNMGSSVTAAFMHGATGVFHDNAMQYNLPSVGGFNGGVTYIANDGLTARTSAALVRGSYSAAGTVDLNGIKLGAGFSSTQNAIATAETNKSYFLGAGTDLGFAKVNALYLHSGNAVGFGSTLTGESVGTWGVNSSIPLAGALTGIVSYYSTGGTNIKGTDSVVGLRYALSSRTTLYGNYEKATGATILGLGQNGGTPGQGTDGTILSVGVRHTF